MSELLGQICMFDSLPDEPWYMAVLRKNLHGGKFGWQDSRIRIYTAALRLDKDRLADYIQNEYGISGGTLDRCSIDFNCRGAEIRKFETGEWARVPWCRIRDMIVQMINNGDYLQPEDEKRMEEIRKEHNGNMPLERPDGMSCGEAET